MKYALALLTFVIGLIFTSVPLLIAYGLNQLVDLPTALVWASWIIAGGYALIYFVYSVLGAVLTALAVNEL